MEYCIQPLPSWNFANHNLLRLASTDAIDTENPELKWNTKASAHASAHLGKREAAIAHGHLAKHDIRGTLNLLKSLGMVAKPVHKKRSTAVDDGISIQNRQSSSDEIFFCCASPWQTVL
jgi:hypothetical protein